MSMRKPRVICLHCSSRDAAAVCREGYDEPEILPSSIHPICLMSADGGDGTDARPLEGNDPLLPRDALHWGIERMRCDCML
jgi:hypothetical protein